MVNLSTGSGEVFRQPEEQPKLGAVAKFSLVVPGYYSSKRAHDRFDNCMRPELHARNIAVIGLHPGLVATERVAIRIKDMELADGVAVPARMIVYFAACENPWDFVGRLFWGECKMAALGIELASEPAPCTV
jgi:NAD(P)-dependent dehydrogenase (short-subunit alcohol dehydrogenase family)